MAQVQSKDYKDQMVSMSCTNAPLNEQLGPAGSHEISAEEALQRKQLHD